MDNPATSKVTDLLRVCRVASGCTTGRLPVPSISQTFDPALITLREHDTLCSNHTSGNRWLLNDVLISTDNKVLADQTGTYVLIIDSLGCVSSDTIEFIYPSVGPDLTTLTFILIPLRIILTFLPFDHSAQLDIMESSGKACLDFQRLHMPPQEGLRIDIKSLSTGMYFAVIRVGQRKRIMKFIKAD